MNLTKYLGVYDSLEAVWQSYPGGGIEGDYVLAGGKVYGWNIFEKNWTVPDIAPSMSEVRKTETVYGDMHVHHDLSVGGILRARVVRGRNAFCGLFASAAALEKHYADPYIGQWALVAIDNRTGNDGNAIGKIYACEQDGVWKDTGQKGGNDGTLYEALQTEREERMEVDADLIVLISNETKAREEADAVLQRNIEAEARLIQEADEALQENINAEARLRQEADEALQESIETLENNLQDIDNSLQDINHRIDTEEQARQEADAAMKQRFDDLVGKNASEAIDNFNEILSFLDGLKDTDKLAGKLADLSETDKQLGADVLELQKTVFPLEITFTGFPLLIEAGVQTRLVLSWSIRRKGADVTEKSILALNGQPVTGRTKTETINSIEANNVQYALNASFEGVEALATITVRIVHGTYFGSVAHDWVATEANIKALGKSLKANREATYSNISTNNGKICYCYPASYGQLTSIKDGNGYEVRDSYTMQPIQIDSIDYYCYILTTPVTSTGVTQIYR